MLRSIVLLGLASSAAIAAPARAQPTADTPAAASINGRAVVADVRRILAANYVLPDMRPKLDAVLAKGLASGRYDVSDPAELATRINTDLASVAHDKHLGMHYDPREQAGLAARPAGAGADDAPPSADDIREATRFNHGITELKVLPGNIRYMNYQGFMWAGPKTAEALDNAMRFLRDGDAIIIDLRQNGGGSPEAVQYLVSHFLDPNRKIVTFYMRGDPASPLSSLASLPAGRMVGKVDPRFMTLPQRYAFTSFADPSRPFDTARAGDVARVSNTYGRFDLHNGTIDRYFAGETHSLQECSFVPRRGSDAEGDGYLIGVASNFAERRSELIVADAQHLEDGDIARVILPAQITKLYDMDFGFVTVTAAGTAVLDSNSGNVTTTGGVVFAGGLPHAAQFEAAEIMISELKIEMLP